MKIQFIFRQLIRPPNYANFYLLYLEAIADFQKKDQIFKSNEDRYIPLFYVALFLSYSKHYVTNFFFKHVVNSYKAFL